MSRAITLSALGIQFILSYDRTTIQYNRNTDHISFFIYPKTHIIQSLDNSKHYVKQPKKWLRGEIAFLHQNNIPGILGKALK